MSEAIEFTLLLAQILREIVIISVCVALVMVIWDK